jgi:hypothetical protein
MLRRLVRNLPENAQRDGGGAIKVMLAIDAAGAVDASNAASASVASHRIRLQVCDIGRDGAGSCFRVTLPVNSEAARL